MWNTAYCPRSVDQQAAYAPYVNQWNWNNSQIMGKRPLGVTKNRKILWSITWQLHEILDNVTKNRKVLWLITWQSHDSLTIKGPVFGHSGVQFFWIPSLVCPALSLSSSEVKARFWIEFARALSRSSIRNLGLNWIRKSAGPVFNSDLPRPELNSQERWAGLQFWLTACLGEKLSLYSASLAKSKLAAAARLLLSKDRCLVQSCGTLPRRRGRLGEIPPGLIS